MEDVTLDDLLEQLDSAKRERLPDADTVQTLRWQLCCWLASIHFCHADGTPQPDEPTQAETLQVCDLYGLSNDLNHINFLAAWTYIRLETQIVFTVVEKLAPTLRPSDPVIQQMMGALADDIAQDLSAAPPEDTALLTAALDELRALTPDDVREVWTICMALGIPPFPTASAAGRQ